MGEGVRAACVIGWPVKHSRSPLIHDHWIKQYNLDADYRREEIAPEAFADFIAHLSERGYVGANITIPHKEAALAMSEPDDRARAVGAANTLWYDGGRLHSTNTDVEGFTANLDAAVPGWDKRAGDAVVLGAGGSARAHRLWPDRARHRQDPCGQPHAGAGGGAAGALRPGGAARQRGGAAASARPHGTARQHDLARHDRPAAARHRSRAAAASCRGRRSGLCPAWKRRCWRRPAPVAWPPPMGSACCCTRRCGGSSSGSGCARR